MFYPYFIYLFGEYNGGLARNESICKLYRKYGPIRCSHFSGILARPQIACQTNSETNYQIVLEAFNEIRENKEYCTSLDVDWVSATMDFYDQS